VRIRNKKEEEIDRNLKSSITAEGDDTNMSNKKRLGIPSRGFSKRFVDS